MRSKVIIVLFFMFLVFGCNTKKDKKDTEVLVFNLKDQTEKEKINFLKLKLDESHQNLLNPSISKDSIGKVYKSWSELHNNLYKFLVKNNFNWGVKKKNIKLFNKIYFNKDGGIKVYAFRIYDSVSEINTQKYKKLIKEFAKEVKVSIKKSDDFAQCGKISLPNF
ncbi:hypothetical protein SAMN04487765_0026 [Tenacibaculum sp. MAR_2010_89]|uniref:hypothetical protein n=1 Tax=Tenacibaculum sp. MAR_2010_89 TaxID=1250198 RepID=UPI00089D8911|nr:hypothetical protein [Tenacibaculum sp. MAR_2010_89]SED37387.1 hypothetical protein SAMN04487765_0026 [Tenacibaculum sp. MAR_2010_89]